MCEQIVVICTEILLWKYMYVCALLHSTHTCTVEPLYKEHTIGTKESVLNREVSSFHG